MLGNSLEVTAKNLKSCALRPVFDEFYSMWFLATQTSQSVQPI